MQIAIAENSRTALDQNEYERRYADLTEYSGLGVRAVRWLGNRLAII